MRSLMRCCDAFPYPLWCAFSYTFCYAFPIPCAYWYTFPYALCVPLFVTLYIPLYVITLTRYLIRSFTRYVMRRQQHSPYFCDSPKNACGIKTKGLERVYKTEWDWGEKLTPHTPYGRRLYGPRFRCFARPANRLEYCSLCYAFPYALKMFYVPLRLLFQSYMRHVICSLMCSYTFSYTWPYTFIYALSYICRGGFFLIK